MRSEPRIYPACLPWVAGLLIALMAMAPMPCQADLRAAPAWFDTNGPGAAPDWHYRAPIAIPSTAAVNSTIRIDVDFSALLSAMGISGTFDAASPRIVRSNGALAAAQQFTDAVYLGGTDAVGNARGEVRFILEDSGSAVVYHLYFDITQNGLKPAWSAANTINGNFEFGTTGQTVPAGWSASANAGFDAQVRPSENPSINSNTTGGNTPFVTTDGTPHTGRFSYLLGARTQNEPGDANPAVTLSRTIAVPSANPENLSLRYRVEGWDSSADFAGQYDFIRIRLVGSTTVELVGPAAGNYGTLPFSPNYGIAAAAWNQSGYGQYNGWDMDTVGNHHYSPAMTLTRGSQPWFTVSASLAAFAGQTVTLEITSRHINLYRSWCHVDDVAWSVVDLGLGDPQAFGTDVSSPLSAFPGSRLAIGAAVDARPGTVQAYLFDETDAQVAGGIVLYDDGTHGDAAANDGLWFNDGSDSASPTYTIPAATAIGVDWKTVVFALDGSSSTIAATNGLVHIPGQPAAPESPANFFNIDTQPFTIMQPAGDLSTSTKTAVDLNGGNLYPGDTLRYTITLVESAGIPAPGIRVTDVIPAHLFGFSLVSFPVGAVNASTPHGTGPNGTGFLDLSGITLAANGTDTIVFDVTVAASAPTGMVILNTAVVAVAGGTGANPSVVSPPVAAFPAAGNKALYLRTTSDLSRMPPAASDFQALPQWASWNWTLTPALQQQLRFSTPPAGIPLVLMLRRDSGGSGFISLDIALASVGATVQAIGSLSGQTVWVNNTVQAYLFTLPVSGSLPLDPGSALVLTVRNVSGVNRGVRVYTTSGGNHSQFSIAVDTVVNVDTVEFYDAAYPGGALRTAAVPGETAYLRAWVSDPFGSFDITGASVTISGPLGSSSSPMLQVMDSGAAVKIYEYSLALPPVGSDGTWTAVVTAAEGTEGTITHQGPAALSVGVPLLTVVKSANSATANPGDLITYTVQVVNTGTSSAINVELEDAMSPYTALRIAYDGIDALPFRLVAAPVGLTLGAPVYSNNGGSTYSYAPLVSGGGGAPAGTDGNVTHWRLPMNGTLGGNMTGFTLRYQVIVK